MEFTVTVKLSCTCTTFVPFTNALNYSKCCMLKVNWPSSFTTSLISFSGIVRGHYSCPDFTGQNIHDFCHLNDVQTLSKHFQEGRSKVKSCWSCPLCVNYMLQDSLTMQLELAASNQTLGAIEKNVRAYQIKNDVSDFL